MALKNLVFIFGFFERNRFIFQNKTLSKVILKVQNPMDPDWTASESRSGSQPTLSGKEMYLKLYIDA